MKLISNNGMLDVQEGQTELAKLFADAPANTVKIPVVIHAEIDAVWCDDEDGNQSFTMIVSKVEVV